MNPKQSAEYENMLNAVRLRLDYWRFVYTNNLDASYCGNPLVCEGCDGVDVIDRWKALCDEAHSPRFWRFFQQGNPS